MIGGAQISPEDSPLPDAIDAILADTSALAFLFWVIALIALIALIVKLWPAVSQFVKTVNAFVGLPAFMERAEANHRELSAKVDSIHHEVNYNNGGSVKDSQARTEAAVERIEKSIDEELKPAILKLTQADDELWAALDDTQKPEGDD